MYIDSVLSNLNAWEILKTQHTVEFNQILSVISSVEAPEPLDFRLMRGKANDPRTLFDTFKEGFGKWGWENEVRLRTLNTTKGNFNSIDFGKGTVGIEVSFGKLAYFERCIFVNFPIFIKSKKIKIGILIVLMEKIARNFSGVSGFERLRSEIIELLPLNLNYPLMIIGLTDTHCEFVVEELTSELDSFLMSRIGITMLEANLTAERPNYDFKVQLPKNEKIAKEICAFANTNKGGLLMIGVNDDGIIVGIPRDQLDETRRRLEVIALQQCNPVPSFDFRTFSIPDAPEKCLIIMDIAEMKRKPCMTNDRVYIRTGGASAAPANPDDIRRIILGEFSES